MEKASWNSPGGSSWSAMMPAREHAVSFEAPAGHLYGILHLPERCLPRGIVMIVGGSATGRQYRVGSHRQYVMLARRWAESGLPVLRFDHTGFGDSDGD